MGLLQDRTADNLSLQLLVWPIRGNVTFYSNYVNNDSQAGYWDHIYNRTRNANRTMDSGESLWMFGFSNGTLNRTGRFNQMDQ